MKSYTETLFKKWANLEGLISLHRRVNLGDVVTDSDNVLMERLWWFFNEGDLISPKSGLCDEEVICFFSANYRLTQKDRAEIDWEQKTEID